MRADQAIYTSMSRGGRDGYHVVSRSPGVSEAEARVLASWCPSHGALIVDESNRASANIHPLGDGRIAISRTCEGQPEYSGRGGLQVYTHALLVDPALLRRANIAPISAYLDALARGVFRYTPDPPALLDEVELGLCHPAPGRLPRDGQAVPLDPIELDALKGRLLSGQTIELRHQGNRCLFLERILGALPAEVTATLSACTSLKPSSARPFSLCLVP